MTRGYKRQAHGSIHDPIPLTFPEWMRQSHTAHNTGIPEGFLEVEQAMARRMYLSEPWKHDPVAFDDPDNPLDEQLNEYHSMMDECP